MCNVPVISLFGSCYAPVISAALSCVDGQEHQYFQPVALSHGGMNTGFRQKRVDRDGTCAGARDKGDTMRDLPRSVTVLPDGARARFVAGIKALHLALVA
jgi:hypothetical protein